jgi:hypothetical protein
MSALKSGDFGAFDFAVDAFGNSSKIRILDSSFNTALIGTTKVPPISKISTENPYPEARNITYHQYMMNKFWHDKSDSTHMTGLTIRSSESGIPHEIEFARNHVTGCAFAAGCWTSDGIDLHDNEIDHCWDMAFQRWPGSRNIRIHDNKTCEIGYCLMRWHAAEEEAGDNYIYNNRVGDIDRVSDFVALFGSGSQKKKPRYRWLAKLLEFFEWIFGKSVKADPSNLRISFYHNSFSGGNTIWELYAISSMPGLCIVNNVVSNAGATAISSGWPAQIGVFDYNSMSRALGAGGSWYGPHNVATMPAIWPSNEIETEFILPEGHQAKTSGIDVSQPFVINGKTYGPLPGFEPGYFTGAAPDRGWIDRGEDAVTSWQQL